MDFQKELRRRAKKSPGLIVLPESDDLRILEGASAALREGLARIIFPGREEEILRRASSAGIDLTGALFRDHLKDRDREDFAKILTEKRAHRGMTLEKAREKMSDPLWFGTMMVQTGQAAGLVSGASTSSADVFHAALQIIGPAPGTPVVSVAGFIEIPHCSLGEEGLFLYSDCVVVEDPDANQLASIALSSARTWETLVPAPPRVALLSYSTKGSCESSMTRKARNAARLVNERAPELICDGELQFDAAVIPEVAQKKAPHSPVEGRANILIFPDLNSANSNFKNTERLAGGKFRASLVQGLAKPINDLSRGTSAEAVTDTIAATVLQAGALHA